MSLPPALHQWFGWLHGFGRRLVPCLPALHLRQLDDLALLLLPALWTVSLAQEPVNLLELLALLLAATLVRSAAWLHNDLHDALSPSSQSGSLVGVDLSSCRDGLRLLVLLLSFATLLLLLLDATAMLWALGALGLLLGYPYMKRRTLLTQAYLGLCAAWVVLMAQLLVPGLELKTILLLFTATLLWATANQLFFGMFSRAKDEQGGVGSMIYLFGENSGLVALSLQIFAVVALWFGGEQEKLGLYFAAALLLLLLGLLPYQQWLLLRHAEGGALRAYRSNIAGGLLLLLALVAERF